MKRVLIKSMLFMGCLVLVFSSCKPKNAGSALSGDAAAKAYVAPGKYDGF